MFHDYEMFEKLRRGNKPNTESITLFDSLYQKLVKHKLVLPPAVLACKLLSCSDLDERDKKLALSATPQLTYEEMKSSLRRIFSSVASVSVPSDATQIIKEEPVFASAQGGSSKTYQRPNTKFSGKKGSRPTGTTPLNKDGRVSTCAVCGSRFHWANACPDEEKSALVSQEADAESKQVRETDVGDGTAYINLAIITGSLVQESFGKGVLDSACTVTVSGFTWMEDYLNRLSPEQRELVSVQPSDSYIVVGGGERVCAKKKYTIPIRFGDTSFVLTVLVIPGDLPLLISVGSMTKACFVIDFANKTLYTSEKFPIQLSMSTSGHLLLDFSFDRTVFASCLAMSQVVDNSQIEKLHKQFAHCSSEKLHALLRKAGVSVTVDRVKSVINDCDVCQRFGRALPRPVVGLPLAQEWNYTVSLDLHEVSGSGHSLWYLHMIDVFSRSIHY